MYLCVINKRDESLLWWYDMKIKFKFWPFFIKVRPTCRHACRQRALSSVMQLDAAIDAHNLASEMSTIPHCHSTKHFTNSAHTTRVIVEGLAYLVQGLKIRPWWFIRAKRWHDDLMHTWSDAGQYFLRATQSTSLNMRKGSRRKWRYPFIANTMP